MNKLNPENGDGFMITKKTYSKEIDDFIYLLACGLGQNAPDILRVNEMDLDEIFDLAINQSVIVIVSYALEKVITLPRCFHEAKMKAIRKAVLFDAERKKVFSSLNNEKIWFMPLKGSVIKEYYPEYGMREMSDNDVLCDSGRMVDVKRIMEQLGFECKSYGEWITDDYIKQPLIFEFHKTLFEVFETKHFHHYYENVFNKLIRVNEDQYEYRFSPEDFYIYMLAHEYKHYIYGGTGLRSLIDVLIFCAKWDAMLDWHYIDKELVALGIKQFEEKNRRLANSLFSGAELAEAEKENVLYFINSGTYGSFEFSDSDIISLKLTGDDSKAAKRKYIRKRIFLPIEDVKTRYPFFYRHKFLLPVLYIYRIGKALITKPKRIVHEYIELKKFKYNV